jgi:carbon-monoxide dehydrogenase iron sulfur subunit
MAKLLKDRKINPNIVVDEVGNLNGSPTPQICFAVSCRHCMDPQCLKACINGVYSVDEKGTIRMDKEKCVGCYTCIVACPYGCVVPSADKKAVTKCELCLNNTVGEPMCVKGCPNNAIVFEEE